MSKEEFLVSNEFKNYVDRIKSYPRGFVWDMPLSKMSTGVRNAWSLVREECIKLGYIECICFELDISLNVTCETFRRV